MSQRMEQNLHQWDVASSQRHISWPVQQVTSMVDIESMDILKRNFLTSSSTPGVPNMSIAIDRSIAMVLLVDRMALKKV